MNFRRKPADILEQFSENSGRNRTGPINIRAKALFDRDALGEVARLVDIRAFQNGDVISQKLHWDRIKQGGDEGIDLRQLHAAPGEFADSLDSRTVGDQDHPAAARSDFLNVRRGFIEY